MVSLGKKITIPLFVLVFLITLSFFLAPLSLEPGTVRHLHGGANRIDYPDLWNGLSFYQRIVYYFGDFNCHQIESRSFILGGNQLPVCARDVGLFVGLTAGMGAAIIAPAQMTASMILLSLLPGPVRRGVQKIDKRIRKLIKLDLLMSPLLAFISVLLALPMVLDGSIQLVTSYESTNLVRVITGFAFALTGSLWFTAYVHSALYEPFEMSPNGGDLE